LNIDERIAKLEQDNIELKARIDVLSRIEQYVTPAQLAKILLCSKNHIYIQIRSGTIQAVTVGSAIRIPMSQFETNKLQKKNRSNKKLMMEPSDEKISIQEIRNRVFE
jgi:excisionase family DNA binding protein